MTGRRIRRFILRQLPKPIRRWVARCAARALLWVMQRGIRS
jgi:hypothetical protein